MLKGQNLFYAVSALAFITKLPVFSNAQTYSISWAQQQPAWVFPLWFEDGSGAKDTLYLCYRTTSQLGIADSLFGVVPFYFVTGEFKASFYQTFPIPTTARQNVYVSGVINSNSSFGRPVLLYNVQLPLIVRWDVSLFRNDSLPFLDQSPAPRAQGTLGYDMPMETPGCSFSQPIVITDSVVHWGNTCFRSDSVKFDGSGVSILYPNVYPWTGMYLSATETTPDAITVFPNPVNDKVFIWCDNNSDIFVTDLIGRIVYHTSLASSANIDVSSIPDGVYLLIAVSKDAIFKTKLVINH